MTNPNNKNKDIEIDETILDETPPSINEPQKDEEEIEESVEEEKKTPSDDVEEAPNESEALPEKEEKDEVPVETEDQKEKRYKSQQSETQIQTAKNRDLINKVDEASKIGEPTIEELRAFVAPDGITWDDLTPFEQSQAKRTYISEKRFSLINEAVQSTKKIDEWASKVDEFIDNTDSKPEYKKLSGHEADFRRFAMQESHRGADIESLLLPAFLNSVPAPTKKRGSLFETGGGGEKEKITGKITDTDTLANLRITNPREYRRQLKKGNVDVEL